MPKVHFISPVRRIEQIAFDSRKLGPCDAFFKLVHDTKTNTFKVTTKMKGKPATIETGKFKLTATGRGKSDHMFGVRRREDGKTELLGAVPRSMRLPRGTVVSWYNKTATDTTMVVEGTADGKTFNSKKMNHHEGFGHVFLKTGVFKYHNGLSGNKRKWGQVTVKKAPEPMFLIKDRPILPVLVECKADGFHPDKVEIFAGQWVGWIVLKMECVS